MSILKNGYSIDHENGIVKMTKDFAKNAKRATSPEYRLLKRIKRDFPDITVERRTVAYRKKKQVERVPYSDMEKYIGYLRDKEQYFTEMRQLKEFAPSKSKAYALVNEWFLATFPDYKKFPRFDSEGFLIFTTKDKTAETQLHAVEPSTPKAS